MFFFFCNTHFYAYMCISYYICQLLQIKKKVEDVLKQNSLCVSESQVGKIIQLHEMMNTYHNVILLGKSGSGKTVSWKTLKDVYSILDKSCKKQEERTLAVQVICIFALFSDI